MARAVEGQFEHESFKPEDYLSALVALLGLMAVMAGLLIGAVIAIEAADLFTAEGAGDAETLGTVEAVSAWNPVLTLFGASLLMVAVVLVLRRIIKTIRLRATATRAAMTTLLGTSSERG